MLSRENLGVMIVDESSKIDLNFIDFTLFKESEFQKLLNNRSWVDLQDEREALGFINNIEIYREYFRDDVEFGAIFTTHSKPNINNSSDISLEMLYNLATANSSRASIFINKVITRRKSQNPYTEEEIDKEIRDYVTALPSWNINTLDPKLLKALLSKYDLDYMPLYREIKTEKELKQIYRVPKEKSSLYTYLGVTTTCWKITVEDNINRVMTTLWYGLNADLTGYFLINRSKILL
ncbi:hypothetical protein EW093_05695 [Thiospirochaeta perfilievii]|uniref:Uncharacterized protein n=1 Tax=Thiospirochaeta perfilievii TaxID=252967 RepID=A0A5C1QA49_9SPIO|nr:general secretion pathway protein GspK [Thiospirochaeta perfilievii]QEN04218.1 hypothetical protein EW093_05695 [Thiospirochaeta perfilievii]